MRKILSMFFLLLVVASLHAQQRTVTGTVRDDKGDPVPFATVTEAGTKNAVQADANGNFSIKVGDNARLAISASGFTNQTIAASGNTATVVLVRNNGQLQEVVVTALGIQRQKKELGYATARVKSEDLTQAAPVSVATGLQGKVSGLNVTSINNGVFADVKINLRGIRSITGNNNPMLLLDGVQTPLNFLSTLNPNDIADVTVIKGASGAGIYGPDARNGVIVITTKKGGRNGQPVITVSQTTQFEKISFFPKFQTQFGNGYTGTLVPYENWSWGPAYDGTMQPLGRRLPDGSIQSVPYSPTKERENFFNTGVTNQTDISFGVKDFYLSVQDARIKGIVPDDENRRTGIRLNTAREYGKFRAAFNVNYIQQNYNVFNDSAMGQWHIDQGTGLNDGLLNLIFNTPAHVPLSAYKDFNNNKFADFNGYFNDYGLNPYFAIDNWRSLGKSDNLISNLEFNFKATPWLGFTWRGAGAVRSLKAEQTSKGEVPSSFGDARGFNLVPGSVWERSQRTSNVSSEFFANFNKTFNDFRVNAIAGHYFRQTEEDDSRVSAASLVVPELYNVSNRVGELGGANTFGRTRLVSVYGSAGVSFKGWANVEVTGRNDWTSVLAIGNNSFFYPGISTSLVLSDALDFIKNSNLVSYLKLRASWNKTGNADIAPYQLAAIYNQISGFPYGNLPGYSAGNRLYDPKLEPEFIESKEVGVEVSFLKNRINVEAAYFHQNNTNQIIPVAVSDATGYTSATVNAAAFVNRGVELDLRLTPLVRLGKLNVEFRANATYNNSEVNKIYEGLDRIFVGGFTTAANYAVVGQPAFVFMTTDYLRDDQGRVIVDRTSGYPSVDPNTKQFGRTLPLWIVGLNPSVTFRGLNLSIVGEYRGGHYAYHGIANNMAWTGVSAATARFNRERFVFPNSVYDDGTGKYVVNNDVLVSDVENFYTTTYRSVQSNFITSANSWRIREVSLGYDVPVKVFGNQKVIKGLTVALNARNLFLWVPKTNEYSDPDFNFSTGNAAGIGTSQINPPTRIVGANLTVTF